MSPAGRRRTTRSASAQPTQRRLINYPRAGRNRVLRWLPTWRQWLLMATVAIAGVVGLGAYAYSSVQLPDENSGDTRAVSTVYYSNGYTQIGHFAEVNRVPIKTEAIPEEVKHAVAAAEDRSFYTNSGVSPRGIGRSVWSNLHGGRQGGSTITQQYIRNFYPSVGREKTYSRKMREAILAVKINKQKNKDEIMTSYLNTIWWGRHSYGIQAASIAWFNKSPKSLTLSQSVFLAGIIQAPSHDDPLEGGEARARFRWQYVLDGMLKQGWIDQQAHDSSQFPKVIPAPKQAQFAGPQGHLLKYVQAELLASQALGDEDATTTALETGGLRIITTIDLAAQDAAKAAMNADTGPYPKDGKAKKLHAGLASIDVSNGGIVAMYGGDDYLERAINDATTPRQPGSTFKAFTLTAALQKDIGLRSRWAGNSPLKLPGGDRVRNEFNKDYGQRIDLVRAIEESVNTAFVDLTDAIGPKAVLSAAVKAGVPADSPGLKADDRITLGTADVSPLSMAFAYSTFAGVGKRAADGPHMVKLIRYSDNKTFFSNKPAMQQVIPAKVARDVTYALQQVVKNGTASKALSGFGRPVAGKTGTANLDPDLDQTTSAWFVGFTPQISTAVDFYIGNGGKHDDLDSLAGNSSNTFFGGGFPAAVWRAYMSKTLEEMKIPEAKFPEPAFISGGKAKSLVRETFSPRPEPTDGPTGAPGSGSTPTPSGAPTAGVTPNPVAPASPSPSSPAPVDPAPVEPPPADPAQAPDPASTDGVAQ